MNRRTVLFGILVVVGVAGAIATVRMLAPDVPVTELEPVAAAPADDTRSQVAAAPADGTRSQVDASQADGLRNQVDASQATDMSPGLIYGRVTTADGTVYQGRLRWGVDEEALWSHYFNGVLNANRWIEHVPAAERPMERVAIELFGSELFGWDRKADITRPFMARYGDIARIDAQVRTVGVTLKSGTEFVLDRFSADDLADGVRVWDEQGGVVDIGEWRIRSIEFLAGPETGPAPVPLHGTVYTAEGAFTGLLQWNRQQALLDDEITGQGRDGEVGVAFAEIASIDKFADESVLLDLRDGRRIELSASRDAGRDHRGIYVDDPRYGRVLVSWDAFDRLDLAPGPAGPGYEEFPPGRPLSGTFVTRGGDRLRGRLVFDLDESESTETLDAPAAGVDYTIPFALVASIGPSHEGESKTAGPVRVTLRGGEQLTLEPSGDLGDRNAGILVFGANRSSPEYRAWTDIERIVFDPIGGT